MPRISLCVVWNWETVSMSIEWGTLIAVLAVVIPLIIALVGGAWARDRQFTTMQHQTHEELSSAMREATDNLHERINRTRDEMAEHYVRRVDLNEHLARVEKSIDGIQSEMRENARDTTGRLDAILTAVKG